MPTYGARMETAAATVAVSGFETEEDALEAVLGEMPMLEPKVDCCGKNFFISGPMSGVEYNNAPEFAKVHAALKERSAGKVFDPAYTWLGEVGQEKSHAHYMQTCLFMLLNGNWDYVVMLNGWQDSVGATLEHDVAVACGMSVIDELDILVPF